MSTQPDDLLNQLGELARVQHAEHGELERLCRGQPARGSSRLLGAPPSTSAKSGSFGSAALSRATARFSADEQLALIASVTDALASSNALQQSNASGQSAAKLEQLQLLELAGLGRASNDTHERAPRAPVAPVARSQRRSRALAWMLPLSAAAGLVLWWRVSAVPELPSYSLQPRNAQAQYRSAAGNEVESTGSAQPLALARAATLVIDLRPQTKVDGELAVRALLRQSGRHELWPIDVERSEHGALRVKLSRLHTNMVGDAELVLAVGRPEALDSEDWRGGADLGRGWQRWRREISLP